MVPPEPREVLVIDDEVDILDVYKDILQTHNYVPIATTLWTEAVDAVQNQNPDLLILDLNMPTIDGVALLKFLREQGHSLPVIVVSGYISKDLEETLHPLRHKTLGIIAIICILIGLAVVIADKRQFLKSRAIVIQQAQDATDQ
ncbi:MAG: response regulator [bacterium]|nr:response regulator [bacterium]